MAYPGRVRIADVSDEEEVMALCRDLHSENGIFPLNEDKVRQMLHHAFDRKGGILGVIGAPGAIEGMIYMMIGTFWYSEQAHLEEIFLYVRPEFRKTRAAIELMKFAKWCEEQTGFTLIIGVISNERTAGKIRLYHRQFGPPVGNFFLYSTHAAPDASAH